MTVASYPDHSGIEERRPAGIAAIAANRRDRLLAPAAVAMAA